jgi:hypothetical protein
VQAVCALSKNCHAQAVFSGAPIYGKTFLDDIIVMSWFVPLFAAPNLEGISRKTKKFSRCQRGGSSSTEKLQGTS